MKKLSPIAFVPRRETVQSASLAPVALYLGAYLLVCFFSSDPWYWFSPRPARRSPVTDAEPAGR